MPNWLITLLTNPTLQAAITRGVMILLAYLFHSGTIPTGLEGAGDPIAALLAAGAASIPAGEKNRPVVLQKQG